MSACRGLGGWDPWPAAAAAPSGPLWHDIAAVMWHTCTSQWDLLIYKCSLHYSIASSCHHWHSTDTPLTLHCHNSFIRTMSLVAKLLKLCLALPWDIFHRLPWDTKVHSIDSSSPNTTLTFRYILSFRKGLTMLLHVHTCIKWLNLRSLVVHTSVVKKKKQKKHALQHTCMNAGGELNFIQFHKVYYSYY